MATRRETHEETEHFRGRVRLYLLVMLTIDLACELIGGLVALLAPGLEPAPDALPRHYPLLHWATVVLIASGWSIARFARPNRGSLMAIEASVTTLLALLYAYLTSRLPTYGMVFALFCTLLALVVRAALVPSSVVRTLAIGVTGLACVASFAAPNLTEAERPVALWLITIGGMFVLATAVISHVIYGLRRQVRSALRLGQYELGRKLGEGSMGVVYEATHVMLRRPTAVKLLPADRAGERTVARFEREVQETSRLEHPNSVAIYDYGRTPEGQFYYAMEYLNGLTLEQIVESEGPVPVARAAAILRQAAEALAEAHARGLVHRDVKPANIMLCERAQIPDTVKVLDFGLVKSVDDSNAEPDITQANALVGTPQYLAPEAITDPLEVGPPSDVYALGAVGFYLITGRPVFSGDSLVDVCAKHVATAPDSPSKLSNDPIDAEFEALILQCLSKVPGQRPSDGRALAQALGKLELNGWTTADARSWWERQPPMGAARAAAVAATQLTVDVSDRAPRR